MEYDEEKPVANLMGSLVLKYCIQRSQEPMSADDVRIILTVAALPDPRLAYVITLGEMRATTKQACTDVKADFERLMGGNN
jgi:hypothetical protein